MPKGNKPIGHDNWKGHYMAIFVNQGQNGQYLKANIEYRYRNEQGEWLPTNYYSTAQLAEHIAFCQMTYQKMLELRPPQSTDATPSSNNAKQPEPAAAQA